MPSPVVDRVLGVSFQHNEVRSIHSNLQVIAMGGGIAQMQPKEAA